MFSVNRTGRSDDNNLIRLVGRILLVSQISTQDRTHTKTRRHTRRHTPAQDQPTTRTLKVLKDPPQRTDATILPHYQIKIFVSSKMSRDSVFKIFIPTPVFTPKKFGGLAGVPIIIHVSHRGSAVKKHRDVVGTRPRRLGASR